MASGKAMDRPVVGQHVRVLADVLSRIENIDGETSYLVKIETYVRNCRPGTTCVEVPEGAIRIGPDSIIKLEPGEERTWQDPTK